AISSGIFRVIYPDAKLACVPFFCLNLARALFLDIIFPVLRFPCIKTKLVLAVIIFRRYWCNALAGGLFLEQPVVKPSLEKCFLELLQD
ncbi:hypothetical protein P175DRAFT_0124069, partial [Aspergillus ochraceoroseus IBT 24754]